MKTLKNILTVLVVILLVSCGTNYKMVTTLDRSGKAQREIFAFGSFDSLAGKISEPVFLFEPGEDWELSHFSVVKYDFFGTDKSLNMRISKKVDSIEQYSKELKGYDEKQMMAIPEESLEKKWGWFYSKYSFKAIFHKYKYETPVSIDNYLTREEQILWSQGGLENCKLLNGSEMNEFLNRISGNFMEWYYRNCFEIAFKCINKCSEKYDLDHDKDELYLQVKSSVGEVFDIKPKVVCKVIDTYYKTTYFSKLYSNNEEKLDEDFEGEIFILGYVFNSISYELVIPGKLLQTNAPICQSNNLVWKVDGMRLLFDDFVLTAEYCVANRYGFTIAGLLLAVIIGMIIIKNFSSFFHRKKYFCGASGSDIY